jgi:DnaJ-class molecular chaperone
MNGRRRLEPTGPHPDPLAEMVACPECDGGGRVGVVTCTFCEGDGTVTAGKRETHAQWNYEQYHA